MKTIAITYYIIGLLVQATIAAKPTPPPVPTPPTPTCNTTIYYYNRAELYGETSTDRLSYTGYAPLYDLETDEPVGTYTTFNKLIPAGSGPSAPPPTCQSSTNLYLDFEVGSPLSTVAVQGFCKALNNPIVGAIVGGTGDYSGAYGTFVYLGLPNRVSTYLTYCKPVAQPE